MNKITQVTGNPISTPRTPKANHHNSLERKTWTRYRAFMISNRNTKAKNTVLNNSKNKWHREMLQKTLKTRSPWIQMRGEIRHYNMNSKVRDRAENTFPRRNRWEDHPQRKEWAERTQVRSWSKRLKISSNFTTSPQSSNTVSNNHTNLPKDNILQISKFLDSSSITISNHLPKTSRRMSKDLRSNNTNSSKFIPVRVLRANRCQVKTLYRTSILIHMPSHPSRTRFCTWKFKAGSSNHRSNIDLQPILSTEERPNLSLWKIRKSRPPKLRRESKAHIELLNRQEWGAEARPKRESQKCKVSINKRPQKKKSTFLQDPSSTRNLQDTDPQEPCNSSPLRCWLEMTRLSPRPEQLWSKHTFSHPIRNSTANMPRSPALNLSKANQENLGSKNSKSNLCSNNQILTCILQLTASKDPSHPDLKRCSNRTWWSCRSLSIRSMSQSLLQSIKKHIKDFKMSSASTKRSSRRRNSSTCNIRKKSRRRPCSWTPLISWRQTSTRSTKTHILPQTSTSPWDH